MRARLPDGSMYAGTGTAYDIGGADLWEEITDIGGAPVGSSRDWSLRRNRDDAIQTVRHLDEHNFLVRGAIDRAETHIFGPGGIRPVPDTGIDGVDQQIEEEVWGPAAEAPELTGRFEAPMDLPGGRGPKTAFQRVLRHLWRETLVAGDVACNYLGRSDPDLGKWQLIKSERIRGTESRDKDTGIRFEQGRGYDRRGKTRYWRAAGISDSGYLSYSDHDDLDARFVDYFHYPYRAIDQSRGYPWCMSVKPLAMQVKDIVKSQAIRKQVESRLLAAMYNEDEARAPAIGGDQTQERANADQDGQAGVNVTDFGFATIFQGQKGQKMELFRQGGAGGNFTDELQTYIQFFCVPLGLARELLLMDFGDMNFSTSKAVMIQTYLNFRREQMRVVEMLQTYYARQIDLAIADGRLVWRPTVYRHRIDLPKCPWLDAAKELEGWAGKIDRCLATQHQALAGLGEVDLDRMRQERKQEILSAVQIAREIEEETGGLVQAEILWRPLAGFDMGKTEEAKLAEALRSGNRTSDGDEE